MKVTFVLPGAGGSPVGGYRVHYEYANRLAERGHAVSVVALIRSRRQRLGIRRRGLQRTLRGITWFDFDPRVELRISRDGSIPRCDAAIVTAWQTAEVVPVIRPRTRSIVQIAYDYEFWRSADRLTRERMAEAFAKPDVVIATSSPVAAMLSEAGRTADAMIRCGLDHSAFYVTRDPGMREAVVGFIARPGVTKRCGDAVTALSLLRKKYDIRVLAVGPGRVELPHWVEVIGAPSDAEMRAFYNELRVFLLPSDYEGWGLTAAEAMACGAAVVSTRNGGVEEFAEDGINALLVPTRDPGSIADACSRLLDDESSRIRIAESATRTARRMDWDESVDALEAILGSLSR